MTNIIHLDNFGKCLNMTFNDEREFKSKNKIILIPLDSRPPCTDFVVDLGKIADTEIIIPPSKLLDYFTIAGETDKIKEWLLENVNEADAIILSIDQIVSGGLISSREKVLNYDDIASLEKFLIDLRNKTSVPIYAFSILPRTQPQQSIDNYKIRRALNAYSRLIGLAHAGLPADDEAFFEALSEVDTNNFNAYINRFDMNEKLNCNLIKLTQEGILDRLIIGLDDGEEYSIQNLMIDNLREEINSSSTADKVSIIHGADEIALTYLAEISLNRNDNNSLKVCILYNQPETASLIMPYMAVPIETVVKEKVQQFNLNIVNTPEEADFTLLVSVNDEDIKNGKYDTRINISDQLEKLISNNIKVALVDLSVNFDKNETLLPILIENEIPINSLISYAGWNTASNAIGTAITQALLIRNSEFGMRNYEEVLNCELENLRFLNQRFIEDQFYLKDGIDTVNHALKNSGSYDTSYLDFKTEYEYATFIMRAVMNKKIADFKCSTAFQKPIEINLPDKIYKISLKNFTTNIKYPWPRTFEIKLHIDNLEYKLWEK